LSSIIDDEFEMAFAYDHQGQRIAKGIVDKVDGISQPEDTARVTVYVNGVYVVKEGIATKHISDGKYVFATKVHDLDDRTLFYLQNHLGSTVMLTDSDGEQIQRRLYTPFGETWLIDPEATEDSEVERLFTNQIFDRESGLYYYNARYYDPQLGVFLTPDPAMDDLNHYAYVRGNPLNYTDPTGLEPDTYSWPRVLSYSDYVAIQRGMGGLAGGITGGMVGFAGGGPIGAVVGGLISAGGLAAVFDIEARLGGYERYLRRVEYIRSEPSEMSERTIIRMPTVITRLETPPVVSRQEGETTYGDPNPEPHGESTRRELPFVAEGETISEIFIVPIEGSPYPDQYEAPDQPTRVVRIDEEEEEEEEALQETEIHWMCSDPTYHTEYEYDEEWYEYPISIPPYEDLWED
jgi:RHS repeat-associated protein